MPMNADAASRPVDLAQEPDFTVGPLAVRPSSREVLYGGEPETLEPRVMQVLVLLARHRGQVVSRDQLIEACWAGRVVGEDAINRCIGRVRRLAETRGGFSVETIARVGYRLTEQEAVATADPLVTRPGERRRQSRWIAAIVIAVLLIGGAIYAGIAHMQAREERAQETKALAQIAALVDQDRYGAAFALARPLSQSTRARANPAFAQLWRQIAVPIKPLVAQSGATVYFKAYEDADGEWIAAGTTPLTQWIDAPRGALRLKVGHDLGFTKAGSSS